MSDFKDHFSDQAERYARSRPGYPPALFDFLAEAAPGRRRALDCATGNGQAALGLADRFEQVVACDASLPQLARAVRHRRVSYLLAPAEATALAAASCDLVTVAQGLHWLDFEPFFTEARRVLRPEGVLAAWCYDLVRAGGAIDGVIDRFYDQVIGPYWPPERRWVETGYRTVPFPFGELEAPRLTLEVEWDRRRFAEYLATWSASRRYRQATGRDPVAAVAADLAVAWGPAERRRTVRWPLRFRVGRS